MRLTTCDVAYAEVEILQTDKHCTVRLVIKNNEKIIIKSNCIKTGKVISFSPKVIFACCLFNFCLISVLDGIKSSSKFIPYSPIPKKTTPSKNKQIANFFLNEEHLASFRTKSLKIGVFLLFFCVREEGTSLIVAGSRKAQWQVRRYFMWKRSKYRKLWNRETLITLVDCPAEQFT